MFKLKGSFGSQQTLLSQKHSRLQTTGKYWLLKIFKFLLHVTMVLDQRKQKIPNFLNFVFKSKLVKSSFLNQLFTKILTAKPVQ